MRVATWNIHRGRGPFGWFRPSRIVAVIAEIAPRLIALQEAQHYLRPAADMLDYDALARAARLRPIRVAERPAEHGWRSNQLLVRDDVTVIAARGLRLGGLEPRGAIVATLDLGGGAVRVIACHLSIGAARRRAQAALLLAAMAEEALPTLLLGDLNEWRADRSALAALRPAFGEPCTAPSFPSFRPALALDHILASPPGLVRGVAAHDTPLARRASDHLPLVGRFTPP
jgi:endonuclease/exonuclease/phosphatase family metal-dependent hydrolase